MNLKVLIINTPGLANRGGMAVLMGAIICIQKYLPRSDITIISHRYKNDKLLFDNICINYNVHCVAHPWFTFYEKNSLILIYNIFPAFIAFIYALCVKVVSCVGLNMKSIYREYDVIIDLNVDSLTEHYRGWFAPFFVLFNDLLVILSNKPLIVMAASISFFKSLVIRYLANAVLNSAKLITVREENSLRNLKLLRVDKPLIKLTADLSFVVIKTDDNIIEDILAAKNISPTERPLIGITITREIVRKAKSVSTKMNYFELYADITDWLIEKYGGTVICLPNVYHTNYFKDMETVRNLVNHKSNFKLIYDVDLSDSDIKALISKCQLTVGSMFHPSLLAISCGVPTIVICSYGSYKVHGVIGKMMDLENYIIDYTSENMEQMKEKIYALLDYIWNNRDSIRTCLNQKSPVITEAAFLNGKLLKDMLQASHIISLD